MCLRRAPQKYITGSMAPVGAALDRAGLQDQATEKAAKVQQWAVEVIGR
jgi:hypothetical protein